MTGRCSVTRGYGELLADAFRTVEGETRPEWVERYNETFFELLRECDPDPYRRAFAATDVDADPSTLVAALREAEIEATRPPRGSSPPRSV